MKTKIIPTTLKAARALVGQYHRHNKPPQGGLFAAALEVDGAIVGVAIAGRPVSRHLDDGRTVEVTRLCLIGEPGELPNAASRLYAAIARAAAALGYERAITYTRDDESGASLLASGWQEVRRTKPEEWSRDGRPREQLELIPKRRWERVISKEVNRKLQKQKQGEKA